MKFFEKLNANLNILLVLSLFSAGAVTTTAQEQRPVDLRFEARGDFRQDYVEGQKNAGESGFKGNIVNLFLQGNIDSKFSYKFRHRLNKLGKDYSFFDATDWLYLRYDATDQFGVMAGKWVVLTGGWEFDPAPIDCFQLGEFTYNFPCYEWGVSFNYKFKNQKDQLYLQAIRSPFRRGYEAMTGKGADMYAFNLMWYGNHGCFNSCWSVNMLETEPGKYINYLYFGNKFKVSEKVECYVDVLNRYADGQKFLFKDCSVIGHVKYSPSDKISLFARGSYDVNQSGTDSDQCLHDGTELTRVGGGLEYYPLGNNKVRVHANYCYTFGNNSNPEGVLKDKQSLAEVGVTWRMQVL